MANNQSNKIVLAAMGVGLMIVLVLAVFLMTSDDTRNRGTGGADGVLGGEFTLNSVYGDISLSDYRGQVVMLYFGFVNCSQVCPISMAIMQRTMEQLTPKETAQVQVLLVSVDVDNDDAAKVAKYAQRFHPTFIGLTGTVEQIDHVIDEYGSYYSPTELKDIDESRAFRHSSRYYIINREGELVDAMRHSTTPNELVARLRKII